MRSLARAAAETATALGTEASIEACLADMDFDAWTGLSFADVHGSDADALARWMAAPQDGAPGGETLDQVRQRIRPWLRALEGGDAVVLAITHAMVVRAILAEALGLPNSSMMQIDIAPLSATVLSFNGRWRLQELRTS